MSTYPNSLCLLIGGLLLLDLENGAVGHIFTLKNNPDAFTGGLRVNGAGTDARNHEHTGGKL